MATYQDIKGLRVKYLAADPGTLRAGEVWYNSTTGTLKGVVSFRAYSSATPLPSARSVNAPGGASQNSGMSVAGSPSISATEEYNGSGWSAGGAWPTTKDYMGGAGPQTAALAGGGGGYPSACNIYDGTTWTGITAMPAGYEACRYVGTSATGLMTAGGIGPGAYPAESHEWGGSSWTAGGALPGPKNYGSNVAGTQTASYSAGGSYPQKNTTANYDGTSWTVSGNLPTNTYNTIGNSVGTQTSGVATGGNATGTFAPTVYHYDGSVWAADINSPLTYTNTGSSWGPQSTHVFAGGAAPGAVADTVEYNVSTSVVTPAAWAAGGTVPYTSRQGMSFGTQTAAIACGGYVSSTLDTAASYDGSSWTASPALNVAARLGGVAGTQAAGLEFGGIQPPGNYNTNVQTWNGSAWANNPLNLTTGTYGLFGCGTQTAALKVGGENPAGGNYDTSEEYDGEGWTAGGTMPEGKYGAGGGGTQTSAILAGGTPSGTSSFEYNGSAWTAGGSLVNSRGAGAMGAATDQNSALIFGGSPAQNYTEGYDGTAWSTRPALATGRGFSTGNGTEAAALCVSGGPPSGTTTLCEEYTAETSAESASTLTTS